MNLKDIQPTAANCGLGCTKGKRMDKSQWERGMWVTINTGSLKGAMGKIKRVDQRKREVLVEIDGGLITNTFKTHRMSWNNVSLGV